MGGAVGYSRLIPEAGRDVSKSMTRTWWLCRSCRRQPSSVLWWLCGLCWVHNVSRQPCIQEKSYLWEPEPSWFSHVSSPSVLGCDNTTRWGDETLWPSLLWCQVCPAWSWIVLLSWPCPPHLSSFSLVTDTRVLSSYSLSCSSMGSIMRTRSTKAEFFMISNDEVNAGLVLLHTANVVLEGFPVLLSTMYHFTIL